MKKRLWYALLALLVCAACSKDEDENDRKAPPQERGQAVVSLLVTTNGVGDLGYNDSMVEELFRFYEQTGTVVRLLIPEDMSHAEKIYYEWLKNNAQTDSAVIILGSSAYEEMAREIKGSLTGKGSRVLLVESQSDIEGVSTVMINRYGASYQVGALFGKFPIFVLAAMPGVPMLETAIRGLRDGQEAYKGPLSKLTVEYLADSEQGFAMPDSAYNYMSNRIIQFRQHEDVFEMLYNEVVFPLLGGSSIGLFNALDDQDLNLSSLVGMDNSHAGYLNNTVCSVVIHIDNVIHDYLIQWKQGLPWAGRQLPGLRQGAIEVVVEKDLWQNPAQAMIDERFRDAGHVLRFCESLREEAITKEEEYAK